MTCLCSEYATAAIYEVSENSLTLTTTRITTLKVDWIAEKEKFTTATLTTRLKLGELRIEVGVEGESVEGKDVAVRLSTDYQGAGPGQGTMVTEDDGADVQRLNVTLFEGSGGTPLTCDNSLMLCPLSGEKQEIHTVSLWADSSQSAAEGHYQAIIDVLIYT
ncbi:hypothetical protein [Serratia sp. BIGb0163]|uniref:hypothetical protein n=1 Tax=Serratia sp. BIGb0163 TaxID=2940613 RepID=UPI0021684856|nr:hypothetical protein [Serratia sp. BIGb0163]MCS4267313.1 hypothetical protein [Serratia sp. BIGb0163]